MTDILALVDFETTGLPPFSKQFPIEVGMLFVREDNLSIVGAVDTLIKLSPHDFNVSTMLEAFQVNNMCPKELANAPSAWAVVTEIMSTIGKLNVKGRVRLVSDNITFDEGFMRRLWYLANKDRHKPIKWPFHYSSDDTGLLFRAAGIERSPNPHRAMADVGNLYTKLVEARRRVNG